MGLHDEYLSDIDPELRKLNRERGSAFLWVTFGATITFAAYYFDWFA